MEIILKRKLTIIGIAGLLCLSCWNKQEHDITRPEVPHYTLSGVTVDYVTGEPVPQTTLRMSATLLLYDIHFPTQILETDSAGHYSISPVYPGNYILSIKKDNCWLQGKKLEIGHMDRELQIKVPNVRYAFLHPQKIRVGDVTEYWHVSKTNPCFSISGLTGILPTQQIKFDKPGGFFFGKVNLENGRSYYKSAHETGTDLTGIYQITTGNGQFYACKWPDSIMVFHQWQYNLINKYSTGIFIKDIAFNMYDKKLYACTDSLFYNVDLNSQQLSEISPLPVKGITTMTWHDDFLYLMQRQEDLLYKINPQLQIEKIYAIVNRLNDSHITRIFDMNFDGYDNLWVTRQ